MKICWQLLPASRTISATLPRHLVVAKSGERRQTVTKHESEAQGENPYFTRILDESGRRESNSRSQLGKLMFCR